MQFDIYTVIVVGIICFTVLIVLIIIANTFKRVKIRAGDKGEVELGGTDSKKSQKESHKNKEQLHTSAVKEENKESCFDEKCNSQKISYIAMTIVNICYKIDYITLRGIMEEQMNWTEQKLKVIKELDIRIYLNLLKEKLKSIPEDSIVKDDSFMGYINVTYRVYGEVREAFKNCYIENHIQDLKESEWEDYKKDKIEFIISKMNEVVDMTYATNSIIGREEIREELKLSLTPRIKNEYNDIFDKARKISRQKTEIINELRKELDDFQLDICGLKKPEK